MRIKTKYIDADCQILLQKYRNGNTAILLIDSETHEPVCKATVNDVATELPDGYVMIKDWSENTGILEALIDNKVIDRPVAVHSLGFCTGKVCKLLINKEE